MTVKRGSEEAPETMVDKAMRSILDHIHRQGLMAGDPLQSEAYFIEALGVSRTVVREAFKSLAAMRILEMSAGRRTRVAAFDDTAIALTLSHALRTEQLNPQQLLDARRAIELRTVELAAGRRSEAEARELLSLVERMRTSYNEVEAMTEADIAFHVAVAQATRNPLFPVLVSSLTTAMHDTNTIVWRYRTSSTAREEVVALHGAIAQAIMERDPDAARAALEKHFEVASQGLILAGFN
ncbi:MULTISPECIES: FadR/GntR family transcriptional regulator [Halomonadaceae]|jgi:GntR family transcriptional repressor for pyruvate dehydrogenase complex|uniref:FadR family transcriptional regulator n=1 Tax=Billgrantia aerodenitrificans TaxID=2733483 RepID=A0ABS9ASK0_9GAMM|nr:MULTISPECIES: FadR/GntR family transcriptional regulator [Halomonas]MCE8024699.1 FadR family transcriptional regulator [Halomonas aerodenitrificans]MCE8038145.1 FadR family transcriptional regulator [Halomonas sp. MCCC 1A11062]